MDHDSDSPLDRELDQRLAARPLLASKSFTDRTLARLRDEALVEPSQADSLLGDAPLRTTPGFTDRIVAATRADRARTLRFRLVATIASAACLALVASFALRPSSDSRLARTLAEDAELAALASLPVESHRDQLLTGDLAALADLGDAFAPPDLTLES